MGDINSRPVQRSSQSAQKSQQRSSQTTRTRSTQSTTHTSSGKSALRANKAAAQGKTNLTLLRQEPKREKKSAPESEKNAQIKKPKNRFFGKLRSMVEKYTQDAPKEGPVPGPRLRVSIGTLVEIEVWAERARRGTTRGAFGPVMDQIVASGAPLDDAVHALTLAQIMPYDEMIRRVRMRDVGAIVSSEYEFVYGLSQKYVTSIQNVVDRIAHVRRLTKYYEKYGNDKLEEEIDD